MGILLQIKQSYLRPGSDFSERGRLVKEVGTRISTNDLLGRLTRKSGRRKRCRKSERCPKLSRIFGLQWRTGGPDTTVAK